MFEEVWRAYEANELSHSAAHYLMAIHELRRQHGYARVSDVAKHLQLTKGSVSSAMKQLKERGYVQEDHNRFLELTNKGLKVVEEVEATRLIVQKFLAEALAMDEDDAQIDACKVEHLLSSDARVRLVCFVHMLFSGEPAARKFLELSRNRALECRGSNPLTCRLCDDFFRLEHPEITDLPQ